MSCSMPSGGRRMKKGGNDDPTPPTKSKEEVDEDPKTEDEIDSDPTGVEGGRRRRITRKGYTRKSGVHVRSSKVRDMGAPGKWRVKHGPGIGELEAGKLHGYATNETKRTRHMILKKDVKRDGALKTMKRLNAISVYMKRTAPSKSKTAKADRNWVKKTFMKK